MTQCTRENVYLSKAPFDYEHPDKEVPVTVVDKSLYEYLSECSVWTQLSFVLSLVCAFFYVLLEPAVRFLYYFVVKPRYVKLNRVAAQTAAKYTHRPTVVTQPYIHEDEYYETIWDKNNRCYGLRVYDPINDFYTSAQLLCNSFYLDPYSQFQFYNKPSMRYLGEHWFQGVLDQPDSRVFIIDHVDFERICAIVVFGVCGARASWFSSFVAAVKFLAFFVKYVLVRPLTVYYLFKSTLALVVKTARVQHALGTDKLAYVKLLAVDTPYQKQGLASQLLRKVTHLFDAQQITSYLESSSPLNIPLYEKFGFRVCEVLHVMPDAPPLYLMLRPPATDRTHVST